LLRLGHNSTKASECLIKHRGSLSLQSQPLLSSKDGKDMINVARVILNTLLSPRSD
jgi:hypothetical protein